MLSAFGEANIAARRLHIRAGFVELGAFPAITVHNKADSDRSSTRVEVEYCQLRLQTASGGESSNAHAASTAHAPIHKPSSITRLNLARPVHVSVRKACIADLPAMLAIVNHSIRESTANLDECPYALDDKRPWFEAHIQQCMFALVLTPSIYIFSEVFFSMIRSSLCCIEFSLRHTDPILIAYASSPSHDASSSISVQEKSSAPVAADDLLPNYLSTLEEAADTVLGYCYLSAYCSNQRAFDRCVESTIYVHPDAQVRESLSWFLKVVLWLVN